MRQTINLAALLSIVTSQFGYQRGNARTPVGPFDHIYAKSAEGKRPDEVKAMARKARKAYGRTLRETQNRAIALKVARDVS